MVTVTNNANIPWETKTYNLKHYTIDEEAKLPFTVRQTRENKIRIIDTCNFLLREIDSIIAVARLIPELDDENHSEIVNDYANAINNAKCALYVAKEIGFGRKH